MRPPPNAVVLFCSVRKFLKFSAADFDGVLVMIKGDFNEVIICFGFV